MASKFLYFERVDRTSILAPHFLASVLFLVAIVFFVCCFKKRVACCCLGSNIGFYMYIVAREVYSDIGLGGYSRNQVG